jgi:hypothetical protein
LERMYSLGKPPDDVNALENVLKTLESTKTAPPRIVAEDRARAERVRRGIAASPRESPVERRP